MIKDSIQNYIFGTGLNLAPESNAMQGAVICYTICHRLTVKLTSSLFICFDVLNKIDM
jgi:hypothetical protein